MAAGGLGQLGAAMAVFLVSHSLAARPAVRRPAEARLGRLGFALTYSALSLLLLGWVVAAALAAPYVPLWPQAPWTRWVPALAMPWACVLAVAGLTTPNPFSLGPGGTGFDPARPGILRLTRHPIPWALALWAGAHLVPNGNLAAVMLFAPLLALALAGPRLLEAGRRRAAAPATWSGWLAAVGRPPALRALLAETGPWRLAGGLALYGVLIALHPHVIGRNPLP